MEAMEPRLLLSGGLLGVALTHPVLAFNNVGTINYDAGATALNVDATPLSFQQTPTSLPGFIAAPSDFVLACRVGADGELIGGVAGDDLVVEGAVDLNGDFVPDVSGTLLTAEVAAFGWEDVGADDVFDFLLEVTGGALSSYYPDGVVGIKVTSEQSSFAGDFAVDFGGGAKGNLGAPASPPALGALGDTVWLDEDADGVQDAGEPGVEAVEVELYDNGPDGQAGGGDDVLLATTTTDAAGQYVFDNLTAGSYHVEFQAPAGLEFTDADQGTDDAVDSDADVLSGRTAAVLLGVAEVNLTVDAGLIAEAGDGAEGCTPGFWKQCQHLKYWEGYSPSQSFKSVFGVPAPCGLSLLDALKLKGGGKSALARHAVAGLLNAAHPDINYAYTEQQVISMVQHASQTGEYEQIKDLLEAENEKGCDVKDDDGCGGHTHPRRRWGGWCGDWTWHKGKGGHKGCGSGWVWNKWKAGHKGDGDHHGGCGHRDRDDRGRGHAGRDGHFGFGRNGAGRKGCGLGGGGLIDALAHLKAKFRFRC